ncbi:M56 family metallopeptidase [Flavobacterium sp. Arc3]|jgi:beta-lactamase regulating signal transducer with metallopeptidase domain|uniref:M56 family metallopeptidase n=1 Tax=unclassified Flavobacterium TaxID=196869 RepID=UPI00352E8F15
MNDFLIKSTVSLFVLLVAYHLVLEKEKIHQFNRFYLLFCLLFSFTIPFITFEVIQEITNPLIAQNTVKLEGETIAAVQDSTNYWLISIWSIYTAVTSILLYRFIRNIIKLNVKAKSSEAITYKNSQLILLKEATLPYTFLNKIFINQDDYHNRKIEAELYTHELIHVTQRHTLDILLIETLKVFFWFNPIFIFYKKAIQLNHEFLADEKVVKSHNDVPFYQNLLISKANANPTYYLASNLNYSVTKKRLIMMTKTTSTTTALFKKGLIIPLMTGLLFSLCTKVVAQESNKKEESTATNKSTLFKNYYDKTTFKVKDENGKVVADKKYADLTTKEKNLVPPFIYNKNKPLTNSEVDRVMKEGGPETFVIDPYDPKNIKVKDEDENAVYSTTGLTEKPAYPGGMESFYKFVGENFTISNEAYENKLKGKVYVTFTVEKDGSLTDFRILRDIGHGTGEEAVRVLKLSPKWIPGKINEEPVRTMYSLPITVQTAK